MMTRKTAEELRANIQALLTRENLTPSSLSGACGHARSWMSRFLQRKRHEFQLADVDKIADFFQVPPYDLLRPASGSITNRRRSRWDRRMGMERRHGHAQRGLRQTATTVGLGLPPTAAQLRLLEGLIAQPDLAHAVARLLGLAEALQDSAQETPNIVIRKRKRP